jgi:carbamoyl-phosphate synthase large subunit
MITEKITVLIPSAGFASIDLLEHLQKHKQCDYRLVLADINPDLSTRNYCDCFYVSPRTTSEDYIDFIKELCEKESIQVILPGKSADAFFFSLHVDFFRGLGVAVVVPNHESVKKAIDKGLSFQMVKELGLAVPDSIQIENESEFKEACFKLGYPRNPICIKPSKYPSESGRGFRILDPTVNVYHRMFWEQPSELYYVSYEAVVEAMKKEEKFPPLLVMEYLPGEEYSVYCFCENGKAIYTVANRRVSLLQMSTLEAVVEINDEVDFLSKKICELFSFDYCVNIQLKYSTDRKLKLIEINPRIAGTIMLPVMAGVDMVHFGIQKSLGKEYPKDRKVRIGTRIKREFIAKYYDC